MSRESLELIAYIPLPIEKSCEMLSRICQVTSLQQTRIALTRAATHPLGHRNPLRFARLGERMGYPGVFAKFCHWEGY